MFTSHFVQNIQRLKCNGQPLSSVKSSRCERYKQNYSDGRNQEFDIIRAYTEVCPHQMGLQAELLTLSVYAAVLLHLSPFPQRQLSALQQHRLPTPCQGRGDFLSSSSPERTALMGRQSNVIWGQKDLLSSCFPKDEASSKSGLRSGEVQLLGCGAADSLTPHPGQL